MDHAVSAFHSRSERISPTAVALAALPEKIKGFGHVKERSLREAAAERTRLLARLQAAPVAMAAE